MGDITVYSTGKMQWQRLLTAEFTIQCFFLCFIFLWFFVCMFVAQVGLELTVAHAGLELVSGPLVLSSLVRGLQV